MPNTQLIYVNMDSRCFASSKPRYDSTQNEGSIFFIVDDEKIFKHIVSILLSSNVYD